MYPLWLRISGLVVVALLCLVLGYSAYVAFRRGQPVAVLPDRRPTRPLPAIKPRRNWTPDLEAYINLIIFALGQPDPCCLPIDSAFLPGILDWYEEARQHVCMHLEVLQRGKVARVLVSSQESPTGKHKAIR